MEQRGARVYQFDPHKKKKLKSVNYVSPEKKRLIREREQARQDRRNFYIGMAALVAVILGLTFIKLYFL